MKTVKKFKTTILLSVIILITAGFIFKQEVGPAIGTKAPELAYNSRKRILFLGCGMLTITKSSIHQYSLLQSADYR